MNVSFRVSCVLAIMASFLFLADLSEAGPNWARLYGATVTSEFDAVHQTADGGYIVLGTAYSFGAGGTDWWCLKLDALGNIVWQKTFGGVKDEYAWAVEVTADGGCLIVGRTASFGAGNGDAWCLKLDASGNVAWQKTYGGAGGDAFYDVRATADGGYVLAGGTGSFGAGNGDAWCVKLDAAGNVLWQRAYGSPGDEYALSVGTTADGGYILAGGIDLLMTDIYDAWCLKLDSAGNVLWQKSYGGSDSDQANSMGTTADGGCILAGHTSSFGAGNGDGWCLKLDAAGNVVWQNTYGSANYEIFYGSSVASDGGCLLTGFANGFGAGSTDVYCVRLDASGNVSWQKTFGGASADYVEGVDLTSDGGFVLAGRTFGFGVSSTGSWSLKISSAGIIDPSCPDFGRDAAGVASPSAAATTNTSATVTPTFVVAVPTAVAGVDSAATTTLLCSGSSQGPTITSISSKTSKPGSMATIKGTGFSTDKKKVAVYVGTKKVKNLSRLKTTSIKFAIPRMKKGTYGVYVVVNGQKSNTIQFQIK